MSPDEVKVRLGMTTTKHDAYLDVVIPDLIDFVKEHCNNAFLNEDGVEVLPSPVKLFIAKACLYNMNPAGVESRRMGTVSYNYQTDFPESMMKLLRPYRRLRFR